MGQPKNFIEIQNFDQKSKSGSEFGFDSISLDIDFRAILSKFLVNQYFSIEIQNFDQKSKSGSEFCFGSISLDIDFRAILSKFRVNQNFSSKFKIFIKNRNLGPNFVLAQSHWILTLEQF